jgi:hypothetical protein
MLHVREQDMIAVQALLAGPGRLSLVDQGRSVATRRFAEGAA